MNYEMPNQPLPQNFSSEIWKVIGVQLGIFAAYQLFIALVFLGDQNYGFLMADMLVLITHWIVLLILMITSFSNKKKGKGIGYLLALLLTGVIGFGSCIFIGVGI